MDVRRLMSEMALEVPALTPVEAYERVAQYARVAVAATDSGIILVKARGKAYSAVGTSDNVEKAHMLQAELDEGPCLDAIRSKTPVYVTGDAANDPRWSTWGSRLSELGYRSVVSIRLETRDRTFGSLNAYSQSLNDFTTSDVEVMQYLGAAASAAIASSQTVDNLQIALESRNLIGQAQGILMAVYDLDSDGAFQYLRRLSMHGNIRIVEVAKDIMSQRHELRKHIT